MRTETALVDLHRCYLSIPVRDAVGTIDDAGAAARVEAVLGTTTAPVGA